MPRKRKKDSKKGDLNTFEEEEEEEEVSKSDGEMASQSDVGQNPILQADPKFSQGTGNI